MYKCVNFWIFIFEMMSIYCVHRIPSLKHITLYNVEQLHLLLMLVCCDCLVSWFFFHFPFSIYLCAISASEPAFIIDWLTSFLFTHSSWLRLCYILRCSIVHTPRSNACTAFNSRINEHRIHDKWTMSTIFSFLHLIFFLHYFLM